jgi:hypothetical protein
MDRIYGSRGYGWLSVHGGLGTVGWRSRSGAWEVTVIAQREREREREREEEEVIRVLINGTTWRRRWPHNGAQ